jgi:hypothetical protein
MYVEAAEDGIVLHKALSCTEKRKPYDGIQSMVNKHK